MSIVKKFSDQIKNLNTMLSARGYKQTALNKASAKYNSYAWRDGGSSESKGVDSDHIKIFTFPSGHKSFAFAFNFTNLETPIIIATFKQNEVIKAAKYSELTFKEKIKQFNTLVKVLGESASLNEQTLEGTFISTFIKDNEVDPAAEVSAAQDRIIEKVKPLEIKYQEQIELKKKQSLSVKNTKTTIANKVQAERVKLEYDKIKAQWESVCDQLEKFEEKLESQLQLKTKENDLRKTSWELNDYNSQVDKIILAETHLLPKKSKSVLTDNLRKKLYK